MWGFNFSCHGLRVVFYREGTNLNRTAKGEPFCWLDFGSAVLASAVMGLCICMACHAYGLGYEWGGALAGLGGMIGKEAVGIVLPAVRKYLGIQ